ncbi:uncharacterized protein JCM6883_006585 [Sporobolomyces salmoneus]|uniref:uncharacterized protein n=1 Tax=Sporobolomyces salmoneus TaxID=183962 RepID=UPI00316B0204
MADRYSSGYPPTAPPARSNSSSPLYAPVAQPTPPHLAHSRYSSADLYAIPHQAAQHSTSSPPPSGLGAQGRERGSWRDEADDSDSDDSSDSDGHGGGGNGFGTYRDFNDVRPGVGGGGAGRNSRRISQAPTLSTLAPRLGGAGGSSYHLKEQTSTLAGDGSSTTKLETAALQNGAYETVAVPKISRDWDRGEGLDEKNYRRFEKSRRKRKEMKGVVGEYAEKLRRKWKIALPLFIAFIVALILILYFCIPRAPSLTFRDSKVPATVFTSTDENPFITSTDPVSYYFNGNIIMGLDASDSYVPVHYSSFGITVKLRETGGVIGRTTWSDGEIKIPGKKVTSYEFPVNFFGNYTSTSDPTFAVMRSSCAHIYPTTYRAPLNLTVEIESKIVGVVGTKTTQASIANVTCPIQWSGSAN